MIGAFGAGGLQLLSVALYHDLMYGNGHASQADRIECWNRALHAFATAQIFDKRAAGLRRKRRLLAFLGLVVPMVVGALILSFEKAVSFLPIITLVAGTLGILQFVVSLWALVATWDDEFAYALESTADNYRLSEGYRVIAQNPPEDFSVRFTMLDRDDSHRSDADNKKGISAAEKRLGMRAALHQFQRACAGCDEVPSSVARGRCKGGVCGDP